MLVDGDGGSSRYTPFTPSEADFSMTQNKYIARQCFPPSGKLLQIRNLFQPSCGNPLYTAGRTTDSAGHTQQSPGTFHRDLPSESGSPGESLGAGSRRERAEFDVWFNPTDITFISIKIHQVIHQNPSSYPGLWNAFTRLRKFWWSPNIPQLSAERFLSWPTFDTQLSSKFRWIWKTRRTCRSVPLVSPMVVYL